MNKYEAERRFVQRMKDNYPPDTRIMLLSMGDDPHHVEGNTRGTVIAVYGNGTTMSEFVTLALTNELHLKYNEKIHG